MSFASFVLLLFSLITNCDSQANNTELDQIISLVKSRLSIHSLQCDFTNIYEHFKYPIPSSAKKGQFAMRDNDLFIMCPKKFTVTHARREKKKDNYSNLLELLTRQLGIEKIETEINGFSAFYRYKGVSSSRSFGPRISFREDEVEIFEDEIEINKRSTTIIPIGGDPRWLIGFLGRNLTDIYDDSPKRKLIEALDKPGKFYLYNKDNYKIIWHECQYEDTSEPSGKEDLSFEIWIDDKENITKIIEGYFPSRSFGIEYVKEISNKYDIQTDIDCEHPSNIIRIFEFSDFKEFDNGVRIPMIGIITRYEPEVNQACKDKLKDVFRKYEANEISITEFSTYFSLCIGKNEIRDRREIHLHPETIKVNQSIPDEIFIAPEPTENKNNEENITPIIPWYSRYKSIIFVISCVVIVLIGTFITKHYFGWSI